MTVVTSSISNHPCLDAILFGCDGVLVDSEPIVDRLIWEMLIGLGIDTSLEGPIQRFLGKAIREELNAIVETRDAPPPPSWLSASRVRRNVLLEVRVEAVPHIGHATGVLSRLGLSMAVASGANRVKVELQLNRIGLTEHLQSMNVRIFSVTEVVRSKFASNIYLPTASSLGVSPSHCLVIEDSPTGATAGRAADMTVLAYVGRNAPGPLIAAGVTRTSTDMRELPELLA